MGLHLELQSPAVVVAQDRPVGYVAVLVIPQTVPDRWRWRWRVQAVSKKEKVKSYADDHIGLRLHCGSRP